MVTINIAKDFSKYPIGREGEFSGKTFREKHLLPHLINDVDLIVVDFDGVYGYPGSSFLEEAFAGLVRNGSINSSDFFKKINIVNLESSIVEEIESYVSDAGNDI